MTKIKLDRNKVKQTGVLGFVRRSLLNAHQVDAAKQFDKAAHGQTIKEMLTIAEKYVILETPEKENEKRAEKKAKKAEKRQNKSKDVE